MGQPTKAAPGNEGPTVQGDEPALVPTPGMRVTEHVRLVRELGSGGMGRVWLAEHTALGTSVAVKFLHPTEGPAQKDRLVREARLTARVDHPHAVRVLEQGETPEGAPFLVIELIEGDSLAARIVQGGPLPLASVRVSGNDGAAGLYDQAVAKALANRFTHDAALANELAYRYHLGRGREALAQRYFAEAIEVYERWGASAKVAHLRKETAWLGDLPALTQGEASRARRA